MLLTLLLRFCALIRLCRVPEQTEYIPDNNILHTFTSKTAYRNTKLDPLSLEHDSLSQCSLIQSNTIYRHGTRFPSVKDNEKVNWVHQKIMKSRAKFILPPSFQTWKPTFTKNFKEMATVGYEEMMHLAARKSKFLHQNIPYFNPMKHMKIMSSSISRSKLSAAAYYQRFLNNTKTIKETLKLITENDKALRFFDHCPKYVNEILNNKAYKMQFNRFLHGAEMKKVVREIQQKWKLTDIKITPDDIRVLYVMCGYEISTNLSVNMNLCKHKESPGGDGLHVCEDNKHIPNQSSPLCSLFDKHHYEVIEYLYDLKHYWLKSYPADISWMQSCAMFSPLIEEMMKAARSHRDALHTYPMSRKRNFDQHLLNFQKYHRATSWFGHAETLLPAITLLGLFNQSKPLTSSTFNHRLTLLSSYSDRFHSFRVSSITPFGANLGLDLYHCPNMVEPNLYQGYRVRVSVNEKLVFWPYAATYGRIPRNSKVNNLVYKNYPDHLPLEEFLRLTNLCLPDKYDHDAICVKGLSKNKYEELKKRSDEL